jgi:hypothetical protein
MVAVVTVAGGLAVTMPCAKLARTVDTLIIQRIRTSLEETFENHIDMTDQLGHPPEESAKKFLSRAVAAFCLCALTECDGVTAGKAITDDFHDGGLDAIYFNEADKSLYLVQSKWSSSGNHTIDPDEMRKLLDGIERMIGIQDFTGFSDKIRAREAEIRALMRLDVRIVIVLAATSPLQIPDEAEQPLQRFLKRQNNMGDEPVFVVERFNVKRIYGCLTGSIGSKINFPMELRDWGFLGSPKAFYGQALVSDIARLAKWGRALFAKNIRYFKPATDVNIGIEKTLAERPELFWYLNNGITILCKSVDKATGGLDIRDYGVFNCVGASVVNGAQTCGVIWELARRGHPNVEDSRARVYVRLISVQNSPEDFETDLTRATNTQNRIQYRDYAALDPQQQRLAREMMMDGKIYAYKSGDVDPEGERGCNIEEATVALACATDLAMAVQAKREIGQLWQDIKGPLYTALFNEDLSTRTMWRAVLVLREVEITLRNMDKSEMPRGDSIAVHGNRFILYRVFLDPVMKGFRNPSLKEQEILLHTRSITPKILTGLSEILERDYRDSYLANVFKNFEKNRDLDSKICGPRAPGALDPAHSPTLFALNPESDTTGTA